MKDKKLFHEGYRKKVPLISISLGKNKDQNSATDSFSLIQNFLDFIVLPIETANFFLGPN